MFTDLERVLWGFNQQMQQDLRAFAAVLFPIRIQVSAGD